MWPPSQAMVRQGKLATRKTPHGFFWSFNRSHTHTRVFYKGRPGEEGFRGNFQARLTNFGITQAFENDMRRWIHQNDHTAVRLSAARGSTMDRVGTLPNVFGEEEYKHIEEVLQRNQTVSQSPMLGDRYPLILCLGNPVSRLKAFL